ncbi:MAG: ABC transporter permease subunit [Cypionkella sp.]
MIDFAFLFEVVTKRLSGLPMTLQAGISLTISFLLALRLALVQQAGVTAINLSVRGFVALFRGTPLLIQIFLIYYGLGPFRHGLQSLGLLWLFREPLVAIHDRAALWRQDGVGSDCQRAVDGSGCAEPETLVRGMIP